MVRFTGNVSRLGARVLHVKEKVIDNIGGGRGVKANLEDIAKLTGVSKMTVSRVLRGGVGFSVQTRDKVLQAAERLGYIPNRLAAAFGSDQASTLVGMCVPRLTSGLFGHVLDGVDRALSRLGFQLIIGANDHSPAEEEAWVRQVVSWRPAGLICRAAPIRPPPSTCCAKPRHLLSRSGT